MSDIENRVMLAKSNRYALDSLLSDYLPFIKKQIVSANLNLDTDDMLSIAMLTFSGCVTQYDEQRGNFLSFAARSIKNRLIDEVRKEGKYSSRVISIFDEQGALVTQVGDVSLQEYNRELERQSLSAEIDALSLALLSFGITFEELPVICPKQDRARKLCFSVSQMLLSDEVMKSGLFLHKRLPQTELAARLNISTKTIEKHRKYIVTVAILMSGDYPGIKSFLPQYMEVR